MITEPTARHTFFSTYGLRLRALIVAATLAALAAGAAAAQPIAASSLDHRDLNAAIGARSGAESLTSRPGSRADTGARTDTGARADTGSLAADGGVRSDADRSDGPSGTPGSPDWHLYHHWPAPSWSRPDQPNGQDPAGPPWPAHTPVPAPGLLPPATPPPVADHPASGASPGVPGTEQDWPRPGAQGPPARDPVAAGPEDPDLGLGDPVEQPSPTAKPTTPQPPPQAAAPALDAGDDDHHRTLILSGLLGLALAAIGLTMISLRRRHW